MNDVSRHLSALSAFDEGGEDDEYSALQSKNADKLFEQRSKEKVAERERALVQERKRKEVAELAVTNQIVNACKNALKYAPNDDAATLQTVVDRLRQPTVRCATENLDSAIACLSRGIESLMKEFNELPDDETEGCRLPTKVAQAINALRGLIEDNPLGEKDVDSLEMELTAELIGGRSRRDVEKNGMKRIALLRNRLSKEMESSDAKRLGEYKAKELHLRMQSQLTRISKSANKENEDHVVREMRELEKAKRRYEASKAIRNRENEAQPKGDIETDISLNIARIREQQARKSRTSFRQREREKKLTLQRERAEEAAREEEARLFRLQAQKSSCPYTKTLQGLSADIHKTTESRRQDKYSGRNDLLDCQANRQTNFGTARLFSDSKFRLGNALREAGIANTTAARDAVRLAIPRTEARTTGIRPF